MAIQGLYNELMDALFSRLERAQAALLMLDYDGTLAPFQIDPLQARPYPGIAEAIDAIMQTSGTRLVIISGRRAAEVKTLLGTRVHPEVCGSHGWERLRPDGALSLERAPPEALNAMMEAVHVAERAQQLGARLERKPNSIALHWRGLPQQRVPQVRAAVEGGWSELCRSAPLAMLEFEGGLELRVKGRTKANAVLTMLDECGPDTPAAFLGDDLTDEDAFVAMRDRGLAILVRPELRPTQAQVWLRPPEELMEFLRHWRDIRQAFRSGAGS